MHASRAAVQIPGLAVADVLIEQQRLILGQNTHRLNARIDTVGKRKINNTIFASKGDGWFRQIARQNTQTAALPSR